MNFERFLEVWASLTEEQKRLFVETLKELEESE